MSLASSNKPANLLFFQNQPLSVHMGPENVVSVNVDDDARIDIQDLEHCLDASLNEERAVFAIVANMGSTKEGAVDALMDIVALCKKKISRQRTFFLL